LNNQFQTIFFKFSEKESSFQVYAAKRNFYGQDAVGATACPPPIREICTVFAILPTQGVSRRNTLTQGARTRRSA
jgi:hypothetical protein